jgi:DNA invertase Pin-like site-specific DNA recombinase
MLIVPQLLVGLLALFYKTLNGAGVGDLFMSLIPARLDDRAAGPRGELGAAKREARKKLLEASRRREIYVVLVWRLDRWGRSVTDLLATLQELEYLGVGFVSLTEALDLTTAAGRAMAAMLAVFASFGREILQERTRAGLAHPRMNGKRLGRAEDRRAPSCRNQKTASRRHQQIGNRPPASERAHITQPNLRSKTMKRPKRDPVHEDRIHNEAIGRCASRRTGNELVLLSGRQD